MRIPLCLALALAVLPGPLLADAPHAASCGKPAASAYVRLPPPALRCDENGRLICTGDNPSAADRAACEAAGPAYAKVLQRSLKPAWWTTPAAEAEACREQKEGGSPDEGPGAAIQGSDRIRLLVLGNGCEGGAPGYDVMLAVKSDQGVAVKTLKLDYYDEHQEAPFSLVVVANGSDTLALFTTQEHDLHEAANVTTAYKVDLSSGSIAEYPLFLTESGPHSSLVSSEPTINFDEDESSALVENGKLAGKFTQYFYLKDCPEDGNCVVNEVVRKRTLTWTGTAFAIDHYDQAHQEYQRELAAHRECLKAKFDARTGSADCPGEYYDNCESNNDLSYLNYKAGSLWRARSYAARALEECRDDPKQLAAAQFNDRRSRSK